MAGDVAHVAWSHDERVALVSTYRAGDGTALIDLATGKTVRRFDAKDENAVAHLAFDANDRRAIIGHEGGPTLLFDIASGALVRRVEEDLGRSFVAPDGRLLSLADGAILVRDLDRLEAPRTLVATGRESAYAWAPDGSEIALAGASGVRIIDAGSTVPTCAALSPRGDLVAIGTADGSVGVCDLSVADAVVIAASADTAIRLLPVNRQPFLSR